MCEFPTTASKWKLIIKISKPGTACPSLVVLALCDPKKLSVLPGAGVEQAGVS